MPDDTIYALSSGQPPAAIAIIRISGPDAGEALRRLTGSIPAPRTASLRAIADPRIGGSPIDRGIVLWFPAPATVTGEDVAELQVHGGRAVVAAVLSALSALPGLRLARPGEFTRRAVLNGRIGVNEAEGLADLLAAETEQQRRQALGVAEGGLSHRFLDWRGRVLQISAAIEASIDFADEDDVPVDERARIDASIEAVALDIGAAIERPPAERLRDGVRVVIAGPPNAGKSTLLNRIVEREVAITSAIAGTTRDVIEAIVDLGGIPFLFRDTAGLRVAVDLIEAIGVDRAHRALREADIVLWLGDEIDRPADAVQVHAKSDLVARPRGAFDICAITGDGLPKLIDEVVRRGEALVGIERGVLLTARQREACRPILSALQTAHDEPDIVLKAESLREARAGFDSLLGGAGTEAMLDQLFGRFCLGK